MKKYLLSLISLMVLFVLTGCGNKISIKDIDKYLVDKYNKEFHYDYSNTDPLTTSTYTYIYADADGNNFTVQVRGKYISDNYYHVIYDEEICNIFRSKFGSDYQLRVSSEGMFRGESTNYQDVFEYIDDVPVLHISIYTTSNDFDFIKSNVGEVIANNNFKTSFSVSIKQLSTTRFNDLIYDDYVWEKDIISSDSFWFENGVLLDE